jgi:hypothetical protein
MLSPSRKLVDGPRAVQCSSDEIVYQGLLFQAIARWYLLYRDACAAALHLPSWRGGNGRGGHAMTDHPHGAREGLFPAKATRERSAATLEKAAFRLVRASHTTTISSRHSRSARNQPAVLFCLGCLWNSHPRHSPAAPQARPSFGGKRHPASVHSAAPAKASWDRAIQPSAPTPYPACPRDDDSRTRRHLALPLLLFPPTFTHE